MVNIAPPRKISVDVLDQLELEVWCRRWRCNVISFQRQRNLGLAFSFILSTRSIWFDFLNYASPSLIFVAKLTNVYSVEPNSLYSSDSPMGNSTHNHFDTISIIYTPMEASDLLVQDFKVSRSLPDPSLPLFLLWLPHPLLFFAPRRMEALHLRHSNHCRLEVVSFLQHQRLQLSLQLQGDIQCRIYIHVQLTYNRCYSLVADLRGPVAGLPVAPHLSNYIVSIVVTIIAIDPFGLLALSKVCVMN